MELNSILVIGAGTMGSSIAQWFTQQGLSVHLTDKDEMTLTNAKNKIHSSFEVLQTKKKFTKEEVELFSSRLDFIKFDKFNKDYDLIIEAIIENVDIKKQLFNDLDQFCNKEAIFATNTSSIPITILANDLCENRRKRFLGLHFFNPATIMKLVEIIGHDQVEEKIISDLYKWFESKNKRPAICKDSPGFIVNRVARNYYGESLRIAGISGTEEDFREIDNIMKEVGGLKMGPFELLDLIGVDVNLSVTESIWNSFYQEPRFAPHRLQKNMVDSGRHGRKSKKGFYDYK
ncbi:MAG: 3-hydroxybutyryl-CoA dehydrogenase [Bacteriovoracaceae bacterium]|jgi:3-hydroxybutyryl-CoA dehydrogenase|nr:3-hydroxybutyryl-CoA dehydrogenase [Bacteriovoracaceae bacterium]